jgi:hypothetical protein
MSDPSNKKTISNNTGEKRRTVLKAISTTAIAGSAIPSVVSAQAEDGVPWRGHGSDNIVDEFGNQLDCDNFHFVLTAGGQGANLSSATLHNVVDEEETTYEGEGTGGNTFHFREVQAPLGDVYATYEGQLGRNTLLVLSDADCDGETPPDLIVRRDQAISWISVCCSEDNHPGTIRNNITCVTLDEDNEPIAVGFSGLDLDECSVWSHSGGSVEQHHQGAYTAPGTVERSDFCGQPEQGASNDEAVGTKIEVGDIMAVAQNVPECPEENGGG